MDKSAVFSGRHLLIDAWECEFDLTDRLGLERLFVDACEAAGATVLHVFSHPFPGGASSGVVVLAESHASWHGWTERNHVTVDVYMCGSCDPSVAGDAIVAALGARVVRRAMIIRGLEGGELSLRAA